MQSTVRGLVILMLGVAIGVLVFLFVQVEVGTSFGPMGMSPAMQFLMKMRASENGGQIAPSFEQLGIDPAQLAARIQAGGGPGGPNGADRPGGLSGGPGGFGARGPAALSKNFEPDKALSHSARDLAILFAGVIVAVVIEIVVFTLVRRRRARPETA